MPAKIVLIARPAAARFRHAVVPFLTLLTLIGTESRAQQAFVSRNVLGGLQFALPWDGPGAAVYNPALLAETKRFHGEADFQSSTGGKDGLAHFQGSARIFGGAIAGLAYTDHGAAIDGSNAVYQETAYTPMAAFGWDGIGGSDYSLGFGAALPIRGFNAFGAAHSTVTSLDLGLHLLWPAFPGRIGRIHSGLAFQNIFSSKVRLPDGSGERYFPAQPLSFSFSNLWSSLGDRIDIYHDTKMQMPMGEDEGPDGGSTEVYGSWGLEVRPIPMLGLKVEHSWLDLWTTGTVLRIPVGGVDLGAEMDLSHDKAFGHKDEGRGYLWSLALKAGM